MKKIETVSNGDANEALKALNEAIFKRIILCFLN
jgi:hypothetical protein